MSGIAIRAGADSTDWVTTRLEALTKERAEVAASKPNLSGKTWARAVSGGVVGTTAFIAGVTGAMAVGSKIPYFQNIDKFGSIDAKLGAVALAFLVGAVVAGGAGWGAERLGNHFTRPTGADRDARIAAHAADQAKKLDLIDRQIAAVTAGATVT